ncbi:esterase/lipase family protein [Amorphoplanes digitatis]|uniref:Pimeloyl-ACP methyl ester carboxylesterase n=1 Tax=Actinoplanes digitatis TaxID=1868 RepID=A0A7W7HW02_9ACTN|nr:alpha/beta fold hydrolase [Actinoplanes digitatis]MBB4761733.1 pimeloyl-ACP methyl ester carboxylesterase [Actinoplanes digitatis]BFE70335.1 hypothetical protein GCM10020092_036360 [Actinoplanes digitatis]GID90843.1 hypothetical protein Adi01nite_02550 [Actinoplanes digitatis]
MAEVFEINHPAEGKLDVVFLHGLDGDARGSWTAGGPDMFWPRWLADDLETAAVWSVGYDARSSGWRGRSMSVADRSVNLLALLQNHDIGTRPLILVAHSMGGLIAKEMLLLAAEGRTEHAPFAAAARGVVFLSTPHNGSGLTRAVDALSHLYRGTPAVADLRRNGAYLRHLNDRYRDWVDDSGVANLVFFESRPTLGRRVVDEASANPGIARVRPIGVDADHIDICKPVSRRALVYGQVLRFIRRCADGPGPAPVRVDGANYGSIVIGDGNTVGPW